MQTLQRFNVDEWLKTAFRGSLPQKVVALAQARETHEIIYREMLTQYPRELRDGLEQLAEMHRSDMALIYGTIEELFRKHLEDHAPSAKSK